MTRSKSKNQVIKTISKTQSTTEKPVVVPPQAPPLELPQWATQPEAVLTATDSGSVIIDASQPPVGAQTILIPAQAPTFSQVAQNPPLPPMVNVPNPQTNAPVFDDQYLVNVDYITTPNGVPITADRITRSELYQAGLNVEYLLEVGAITFFTRIEVQNVKS